MTLSPSHEAHVCLLPIILAFSLAPLDVIKLVPVNRISLDLAGNVPFVDLWVPFGLAKDALQSIGVLHFFKPDKKGVGLLSDGVEDLISWEEGAGICHK